MTDREPLAGRLSVRKRVYLLIASGVVIPLTLLAFVGWHWLRGLDDRIFVGRLSAARIVAAHFDEDLSEDLAILQRTAGMLGQAAQDPELRRRALRVASEQLHHREALFVLDLEQGVVAREPASGTADPKVGAGLVEEVLRSGVPRVSNVEVGAGGAVVHELVPIRDWQNRVVGLVGGTFRPARRDYATMLGHLRRGKTGFAELVDGRGRVVASTRPGRVGDEAGCGPLAALRPRDGLVERCDACHARSGLASRPRELATVAPLAAAGWSVIMRQDASEALPTEGAVPWRAVALVLLLHFAVAGVFAWGAARSVTNPVAVLTREAERIASGDLDGEIPAVGEDEVGRLGHSIERMRRTLRDLIADVGAANARLEVRVAERTQALAAANDELRAREEVRRGLIQKLITAQEDERKRIARELHDETSQSLAVLAMGVDGAMEAVRSGRTPRLDEVKALATRTIEDVHRLILDLRPSVLDDLGLFSAIRWYAERTLQSRGISVRCELGELDRRLPPELEIASFRICQECITNVARHARATAVLVQVELEGDALRIEIEDDGQGFDPERVGAGSGRRHWGLVGLRERVEVFGGRVAVESAPGQGTRVEIRIPVPKEKAA